LTALGCAIALGLTACSGKGGSVTGPDTDPGQIPGPVPDPQGGVQGHYVLTRINSSQPGQLVTIANPDGKVIGLYRFDGASTLDLDALQTFALRLRYTDDKTADGIDDDGEFKAAAPAAADGSLPFTFNSGTYGDAFTGVVLATFAVIKYDFDGDGQAETSFGFERAE
jgi:hypothetical protein